ncbi:MAG: 2-phosphosulfolactate phosphatase [Clostridium sp.]|nr:2-phosphosulfolactate phosphatase [Clostridium sp.]
MHITVSELLEGAKAARGTAVIIDVFRAFTVECYLFDGGARRIITVGDPETAYRLKEQHPDALLIGEKNGIPLPGFDGGNSPAQFVETDVRDRMIIHTTSAGTKGIAAASEGAEEVITGSLVNAKAIAAYLKQQNPERVSIVAMGLGAKESAEEDVLCARYIESLLLNRPMAPSELAAQMAGLRYTSGKRFFDPARQDIMPENDFWLSTKPDIFPFVIRARKQDNYCEMERIYVR